MTKNIEMIMYLLLHFFSYTVYFGPVTFKIFSSCINTSNLSCVQIIFSKMKLVKTLFCTQLKQINLENVLYISKESPKEDFSDTVFQHFMDELKHCNWDMQMDLQLVTVFLCLYLVFCVYIWLCYVTFQSYLFSCILLYFFSF